jgi:hypothetical protein
MGRHQFVMLAAMLVRQEEELQMAHPTVAWGMVVTKTAAAAVRCSDDDVVEKGTRIAARASGDRKRRTGIEDTGYGKDATYGNDGGRANATTRGAR